MRHILTKLAMNLFTASRFYRYYFYGYRNLAAVGGA